MKKILHLILFSIGFFSSQAQTNIYHPFPDSNAHWNIWTTQFWGCSIWQDYQEWLSIEISGDTIIAGTNYHKLNIPYIQQNCSQGGGLHFTGYRGAFREDTSLKQVFFVDRNDSTEELLYDFTMEVGDTVKGYLVNQGIWGCWPADRIVTSIDSVLVGGNYRKRWEIYSSPIYFIEGIGSTNGLLDPVCEIVDGPQIYLTCFSQNDSTLYYFSATTCELINSLNNEIVESENHISISPNPFHSEAKLEVGNRVLGNSILKIFNSMGLLVREEKISNINSYILHRDGLSDGLYFYELSTLNHELIGTGKFMIQ